MRPLRKMLLCQALGTIVLLGATGALARDHAADAENGVLDHDVTTKVEALVEKEVGALNTDSDLRFQVASITFDDDSVQLSLHTTLRGLPVEGGLVTVHADPASYDVSAIGHQLLEIDRANDKPALDAEPAFSIAAAQSDTPFWSHFQAAELTYATNLEGTVRLTWAGSVVWEEQGSRRQGRAFVDAMTGDLVRFVAARPDSPQSTKGPFTPGTVGAVGLERVNNCGRYIGSWFTVSNADFYEVHFTVFGTPPANSAPLTTVPSISSSVPKQVCVGFTVNQSGKIYVRGCNSTTGECGPYSNGVSVSKGSPLCGPLF